METVSYAIGDIHGRLDLLTELVESILDFHELMHSRKQVQIICIGDYIDGGDKGIAVIDCLMNGIADCHTVCLRGNHEELMLDCLSTDNPQTWSDWVCNGGIETLEELGLSALARIPDAAALQASLGPHRIGWLTSLPLTYTWGGYLFVHAGIAPGVPIEEQDKRDLLWIRGRFLDSDAEHGVVVVHGHTPTDQPEIRHNRIGIDTGATSNGVLTAAVLLPNTPPMFLRAVGNPLGAR